MNILAIDLSSSHGQVACLQGTEIVAVREVPPSRSGAVTLFSVLEAVRAAASWSGWDVVDLFAAGRGPGRYSGMRVALTAVQHLALPGAKPVRAIDSGAALAHEWAASRPAVETIWVLGDARRDRVWRGVFTVRAGKAQQEDDWSLLPLQECAAAVNNLPEGRNTMVISSDWERLWSRLTEFAVQETEAWHRIDACPSAGWVGRLALAEEEASVPAAAALPLYLHPSVEQR